jgi:hypothetical protein
MRRLQGAKPQATGPDIELHRIVFARRKTAGATSPLETVRGPGSSNGKNAEAGSSGAWPLRTAHRGPASAEGDENLKRGARSFNVGRVRQRDFQEFARRVTRDRAGDVGFVLVATSGKEHADWFGRPEVDRSDRRRGAGPNASMTPPATEWVNKRRSGGPRARPSAKANTAEGVRAGSFALRPTRVDVG